MKEKPNTAAAARRRVGKPENEKPTESMHKLYRAQVDMVLNTQVNLMESKSCSNYARRTMIVPFSLRGK